MYTDHTPPDDLTIIKGIGPNRQQWLRDRLKVHTFHDLAAHSADDIETKLKQDGLRAVRRDIESWLKQAKLLAAERADRPSDSVADSEIWKPMASFVVEFQERHRDDGYIEYRTTAHDAESDQQYETWPGIQTEPASQWISQQFTPALQAVSEPADAGESLETEAFELESIPFADAQLEIAWIEVTQPTITNTALPGYLVGSSPFDIKAAIKVPDKALRELVQAQAGCTAQFYARNLLTGSKSYLGSAPQIKLADNQLAYEANLAAARLEPGTYRLNATAILDGVSAARPTFLESSLFQVI